LVSSAKSAQLAKVLLGAGMAETRIVDRMHLGSCTSTAALTIFQRIGTTKNRRLIVFLHGLGGASFGDSRTWVGLPESLWDDMLNADIAFYSYRTLFARLKFWLSYDISVESDLLADELAGCGYDEIILVGHSLGGVVARLSVASMHQRGKKELLRKISSIALLASPSLGTHWVPSFIAPVVRLFSRDFWALAFNGPVSQSIRQTFEGAIDPRFKTPMSDTCVPVWAVIACEDFWVKQLSASTGVPEANRKLLRKSHTAVTKGVETRDWLREVVERVFAKTEPSVRCRSTKKDHEVRPAVLADYASMNQLSLQLFGADTPEDALEGFLKVDPRSFGVVRHLKSNALKGYWCVLPLLPEIAVRIKQGTATAADIREQVIAGPRDQVGAIYVGAIAATDNVSKGLVMREIASRLESIRCNRNIEILARAATLDGLRLIEEHGLAPLRSQGLNQVYSGVNSISRKGRKRVS
jgi:pimeloyl-ACP methyl ester carboxylesterase